MPGPKFSPHLLYKLICNKLTTFTFDSYSRYSERDSHRSEGEYEEERFVDRKEYDGKWADGNNEPEAARPERTEEKPPAEEPPPKE